MEKNEKAENDLIFLDDLIGWLGEKNPHIPKILLKCLNCGYTDVLWKMLKLGLHMDSNTIRFDNQHYSVFFHCPKCDSCAVSLHESEIPKIVAEKLSQ